MCDKSVGVEILDRLAVLEKKCKILDDVPQGLSYTLDDKDCHTMGVLPMDPGKIEFVKAVRIKGDLFTTIEIKVRHE